MLNTVKDQLKTEDNLEFFWGQKNKVRAHLMYEKREFFFNVQKIISILANTYTHEMWR